MLLRHPQYINLVPLHNPTFGSILRNNIIGEPLFSLNIRGGKPSGDIEFRNSYGYRCCVSPSTSSKECNINSSPGN